ncbi:MAG TPA: class I SAM-dependent methyltransferase [Mycobacteriales bacterium]|nr:class I SAM-dependent methyltransferase [Mycobacteriales bacterium]
MSAGVQQLLRGIRSVVTRPFVAGRTFHCAVCGRYARRFLTAGDPPRRARCAWCGSYERHRFLWRYLADQRFESVLHVAPEAAIGRRLRRSVRCYRSIDLDSPIADIRADITKPLPLEERFDLVVCSHVLEHIPDDRAAVRELSNVLAPGGQLVILVPVHGEVTDEEPLDDPRERERRYGQADHVRSYGRDIAQRLADLGLTVTVQSWRAVPPETATREGIGAAAGDLYICTRATT